MARELLSDELWNAVRRFIPAPPPKPKGGRLRAGDRACLLGILFILQSGMAWNQMPKELGAASPATCWRRLQEWSQAGAFDAIWKHALGQLRRQKLLDLSVAIVDSASVRAAFGGVA